MRTPVRGRRPQAKTITIPAPTLGWNTRDAFEVMKPAHAIILENWVPGLTGIRVRKGAAEHATGLGAPVQSLMEYAPPDNSSRKLFAAAATSIFDTTTAGPVGAAVQTGLTNALWQSIMFANSAGSYLYMVNGADAPRYYNGSTWTEPAFTGSGFTATSFIQLHAFASRIWFVQKASLVAYYLGVSAIAGGLTAFDFGPMFTKGGEIAAIGSWSRDGGDGPDDYMVILTTEGQAAVYAGTDPASPSTWQKVGVYDVPRPIGRRCLVRAGADIGALTEDGPIALSGVTTMADLFQKRAALSDEIQPSFKQAYATAGNLAPFEMASSAAEGLLIVNVANPTGAREQFAFSGDTNAWCKFTGLDAATFATFDGELYMGMNDGRVATYGPERSDFGQMIETRMQTAFVSPAGIDFKVFTVARPLMQAPEGFQPRFELRMDYDTRPPSAEAVAIEGGGVYWDDADWDTADWGAQSVPVSGWQSVSGMGTIVSIAMAVTTDADISVQAFHLMYESGSPL